ncbi:MAG: hypothetical protein AAGG51_19580 [Cyanobacteria bacterium P01_G01_bin.54]
MRLWQLHWVFVLILGLGLVSCNTAQDTTEEPASETETEAVDAATAAEDAPVTLEPAPEGTFAAGVQAVLITSFPEQTGDAVASVACPAEANLEDAQPFDCQVSTVGGALVSVEVFPNPETETFDWRTKGLFLSGIEESIESTLLTDAELTGTADCGSEETPYREEEPGTTFECTFATEDGDVETIEVAVQDEDGNVVWRLKE